MDDECIRLIEDRAEVIAPLVISVAILKVQFELACDTHAGMSGDVHVGAHQVFLPFLRWRLKQQQSRRFRPVNVPLVGLVTEVDLDLVERTLRENGARRQRWGGARSIVCRSNEKGS